MPSRKRRISPIQFCVLLYGGFMLVVTALHFPYHTDPQPASTRRTAAADGQDLKTFYAGAYDGDSGAENPAYVKIATEAADRLNVKGAVARFVSDYHLEHKTALDVGAGRGYLQDLVDDYTGLDISPTARRFFHKRFVLGSATDLPFRDGEFDAAWTIWVLEHVPNPELALSEMRRVVKPGGLIYLAPAWFCDPWAAQGYRVRPYRDFSPAGKLVKASIPIRDSSYFRSWYLYPARALRLAGSTLGPTRFHYTLLTPNYRQYWGPDSDALNSMDPYEALLWFQSRGDQCLNCGGSAFEEFALQPIPMIVRVNHRK